jgi:cytochrome c556
MIIRTTAALAAAALGATIVHAQNVDAIKTRQDAMKSMGNAAKEPGAVMKGNAPFDLAKVQASLKTIEVRWSLFVRLPGAVEGTIQ